MPEFRINPYKPYEYLTDGETTIRLKESDFSHTTFQEGNIVLLFRFCRFRKLVIINEEDIPFKDISIAFFSCILDEIKVETIATKNISIGFYGSVISGSIRNENIESVELNNCLLRSRFFISNVKRVSVKFSKENINLYRWKELFKYHGLNSYRDLCGVSSYDISECAQIEVSSNHVVQRKKNRFKVALSLSYSTESIDSDTLVSGVSLSSLSISGNSNGKISLENVNVDSWYIYNFVPKGDVSFYNIGPASNRKENLKIGVHRCNLDNVWFDNVSFNKYSIISFYRTKFSKAVFTSCNFPDSYKTFSKFLPNENVHYPEKTPPNYHKDQYEIFLQLKKSVEDTGNSYEALKLHAISHDALKQIKAIPRWDRFILRINGWSNDHGLSIVRPFLLFVAISIAFYILYLLALGRIFNGNEFDPSLIGYYFPFVDITHRPDFLVAQDHFTGWSLFLDYVNKLIVGFFIFQFIAAFRKYGKR